MSGASSSRSQSTSILATYFAPAERDEPEDLKKQLAALVDSPFFKAIEDSIDGCLMILNRYRQVLAVNRQLLKALGIEKPECLVGQRPGEVLQCVYANEGPGGCGTSKHCSVCGAVGAIMASQTLKEPVTDECLAMVQRGENFESAEFRVRATPVQFMNHDFTIMVFNDISDEKRRQLLEKTFFHDILNTVGGLMGWSSILENTEGIDPKEVGRRIVVLTNRLTEEIRDHRSLLMAENGSLPTKEDVCLASEVLESLGAIFEVHDEAAHKVLAIEPPSPPNAAVHTDSTLLLRVLVNMTKNALEATPRGGEVRVWFECKEEGPGFFVHNDSCMPDQIALQVFKRSFSTKAKAGRGVGTYSMKLFGEKYLKGKVGFSTSEIEGTTFWIILPKASKV